MGENNALRCAGTSRGILQKSDIVGLDTRPDVLSAPGDEFWHGDNAAECFDVRLQQAPERFCLRDGQENSRRSIA